MKEIFKEFRNNVLCRNESNQEKASKLWNSHIKHNLSNEDIYDINDSWIHYNLNQESIETFGSILKKIESKLK